MRYLILLLSLCSFSLAANDDIDCEKAYRTPEINQCLQQDLRETEAIMENYLDTSMKRYEDDALITDALSEAQEKWLNYREAHCGSVYQVWRTGTIRTAASLSCAIRLTEQRTYNIWLTFLTFGDGSEAILAEPKQ